MGAFVYVFVVCASVFLCTCVCVYVEVACPLPCLGSYRYVRTSVAFATYLSISRYVPRYLIATAAMPGHHQVFYIYKDYKNGVWTW